GENSPGNPFNHFGNERGVLDSESRAEQSDIARAENIRRQGSQLSSLFNIRARGAVMEVGWGGNRFLAEGIYDESHVPLVMFDSTQFDSGSKRGILPENATLDGEVSSIIGDASDMSSIAELTDKEFGATIFNGSLFGSGMNWHIEQSSASEYDAVRVSDEEAMTALNEHVDKAIMNVLSSAKEHLNNNGVLIISSDRFSLFSNGRSGSKLPLEKIQFLNVLSKAAELGAKKFTIIG